jgi:hypothetical protein
LGEEKSMVAVRPAGAEEMLLPADDLARVITGLRRVPAGAASPATAARELLERAQASVPEPCVLDGAVVWEVLWAIQRLPAEAMTPPLYELHSVLLRLTSAPPRQERIAGVEADSEVVTRLR